MKTSTDSISLNNPQHDGSASLLDNDSAALSPTVNDYHDSLLPNIKYGAGMLAFIVIPPLIPGITPRIIITGVMCLIISIYTVAGIMAAVRVRQPVRRRKMI